MEASLKSSLMGRDANGADFRCLAQISRGNSVPELLVQGTHPKDKELEKHGYEAGDLVVYTVSKQSPHPGPRARSVQPAELGEDYSYVVDKFWMVASLEDGEKLRIVTRKGKTRLVSASDPLLRKANWWQRFRYRDRFPGAEVLSSIRAAIPQNQ